MKFAWKQIAVAISCMAMGPEGPSYRKPTPQDARQVHIS